MKIELRLMERPDWDETAQLIHASLNHWYEKNRGFKLVNAPWESMLVFPRVYEALDPHCCILAVDSESGRIAGCCFFHPRPTHVSLGIMNVHPDYFGRKIAPMMMKYITDLADADAKPVRLVSSAMNLDSFSLYNKSGFVPTTFYQDMILSVPSEGVPVPMPLGKLIRPATMEDVPKLVAFERELSKIDRRKDFRYFIENADGIWSLSVLTTPDGSGIDGFMCSVYDPGSNMLGPGLTRTEEQAEALIFHELNNHIGRRPVVLIPSVCRRLTTSLYALGATNCETHITQIRANGAEIPVQEGFAFPTFMPETS